MAASAVMRGWDGKPPAAGWHWLCHQTSGQLRMAFWDRAAGWRVADAIGRTTYYSEFKVSRLFLYKAGVPEPEPVTDADQ